jgi:hypothetical protein
MLDPQVVVNLLPQLGVGVDLVSALCRVPRLYSVAERNGEKILRECPRRHTGKGQRVAQTSEVVAPNASGIGLREIARNMGIPRWKSLSRRLDPERSSKNCGDV